MLLFLEKTSFIINRMSEYSVIFLIALITLMTSVGVVARYVFGAPIIWLYESSLVIFSWMVFLGCSIAFKKNEHIYLEFLLNRLSDRFARWLKILLAVIIIVFLVIGVVEGIEIIKNTATQKYNTIDVSIAWFYLSFPVSAVVSIIHLLNEIVRIVTGVADDKAVSSNEKTDG